MIIFFLQRYAFLVELLRSSGKRVLSVYPRVALRLHGVIHIQVLTDLRYSTINATLVSCRRIIWYIYCRDVARRVSTFCAVKYIVDTPQVNPCMFEFAGFQMMLFVFRCMVISVRQKFYDVRQKKSAVRQKKIAVRQKRTVAAQLFHVTGVLIAIVENNI